MLGYDEVVGNLHVNRQNSRSKVPRLTQFEISASFAPVSITGSFIHVSSGPRLCLHPH